MKGKTAWNLYQELKVVLSDRVGGDTNPSCGGKEAQNLYLGRIAGSENGHFHLVAGWVGIHKSSIVVGWWGARRHISI